MSDEDVLDALMVKEPETTPAPEVVEPEKTEAPEPEKVDAPDPATETPKVAEGTPDKALQKVQQDLSAANRKIEELMSKVEAGEPLTAAETKQAANAKRTIDELKSKVGTFDVFDDGAGDMLAKSVVETGDDIATVKSELAEVKQLLQQQHAEAQWKEETTKYPGVNVKDVWEKAVKDAVETIGDDDAKKLNALATRFYTERCSGATKRVDPAKPVKTTTPVTPGGGQVLMKTAVPTGTTKTEDQKLLDSYDALIAKN